MIEVLVALFWFIVIHLVMWGAYELFFKLYWDFICFGIKNKLIKEDIFAQIDFMNKQFEMMK